MEKLKLLVPKGRIQESVLTLMNDAGIQVRAKERSYRPVSSVDWLDIKIMKPQNIGELLELGSHDAGFTGYDWLQETHADVLEIMDLGFDPVNLVAAVPETMSESELASKELVVATEYVNIATQWLSQKGYRYKLVRTYGATEVFPSDDADMIIDNSSTGETLQVNKLKIVDIILQSSTRFVVSRSAMENPVKCAYIQRLKMLFTAVRNARDRVMLEMNAGEDVFESIIKILPCMRSPTISRLYGESGYAVKAAVLRSELPDLIPMLKQAGAVDIIEYELKKVIV